MYNYYYVVLSQAGEAPGVGDYEYTHWYLVRASGKLSIKEERRDRYPLANKNADL